MSEEKTCKFCGESITKERMFEHLNIHIIDSNTPGAIIISGTYCPQLMHDYSKYTLYGKIMMLKNLLI